MTNQRRGRVVRKEEVRKRVGGARPPFLFICQVLSLRIVSKVVLPFHSTYLSLDFTNSIRRSSSLAFFFLHLYYNIRLTARVLTDCTNFGKIFCAKSRKFLLDKILDLCYNTKATRGARTRVGEPLRPSRAASPCGLPARAFPPRFWCGGCTNPAKSVLCVDLVFCVPSRLPPLLLYLYYTISVVGCQGFYA